MKAKDFISAALNGQKAVVEEHAHKMSPEVIREAYNKVQIANSRPDEEGALNEILDILESIMLDDEDDSDYD